MSFRPLPIMTVCVLASLVVLAMLGNWQWQRYGEKLGAVDAEISWYPLQGAVVHPEPVFVSTVLDGRSAWRLVMVVEGDGQPPVLASKDIYLGIAPPDVDFGSDGFVDYAEGVWVTPPGSTAFTPTATGNQFFVYDVSAISAMLPPALGDRLQVQVYEPRFLTRIDETNTDKQIANPWADPVLADPLPPARHLGYALTWWGIGVGLIVIYLVFHINAGRLSFGAKT